MRQSEGLDCRQSGRRRFMQQLVAAAGAVVTAPGFAENLQRRPGQILPEAPAKPDGSVAEVLADYAVSLRFEDLPSEVVRGAKRTILDTIGCAIAGSKAPPSQIAVKVASSVSGTIGATIFCNGVRSSQDGATFANGVMIRCLDFNDAYSTPVGGGHPSDALAALLASAEVSERNGRELIVATVLAYEVFCKISDVLDIKRLGLDQATVLGLASLVGSCRLMGLNRDQMVNAIGITVGGNTAVNQGRVGVLSNWKDFATAEASRKAIFSAQLAQAGMTGPRDIFEGRSGFFKVISRETFNLPKLGAPYGILKAVTKLYPVGQYAQTVVTAAVELHHLFPDSDQIQQVNIAVSTNAIRVMAGSPDRWKPTTHETADHSIPYAAAVALRYGTIDDRFYNDPYLHDPRLLELVSRIRCVASAEADAHEKDYNLTTMEVVLKSGVSRTVRVPYHRGHWMNPMTDAEMEEKFRSLAGRYLSQPQVAALVRQLWALEDMKRAGELVAMTKIHRLPGGRPGRPTVKRPH